MGGVCLPCVNCSKERRCDGMGSDEEGMNEENGVGRTLSVICVIWVNGGE